MSGRAGCAAIEICAGRLHRATLRFCSDVRLAVLTTFQATTNRIFRGSQRKILLFVLAYLIYVHPEREREAGGVMCSIVLLYLYYYAYLNKIHTGDASDRMHCTRF